MVVVTKIVPAHKGGEYIYGTQTAQVCGVKLLSYATFVRIEQLRFTSDQALMNIFRQVRMREFVVHPPKFDMFKQGVSVTDTFSHPDADRFVFSYEHIPDVAFDRPNVALLVDPKEIRRTNSTFVELIPENVTVIEGFLQESGVFGNRDPVTQLPIASCLDQAVLENDPKALLLLRLEGAGVRPLINSYSGSVQEYHGEYEHRIIDLASAQEFVGPALVFETEVPDTFDFSNKSQSVRCATHLVAPVPFPTSGIALDGKELPTTIILKPDGEFVVFDIHRKYYAVGSTTEICPLFSP